MSKPKKAASPKFVLGLAAVFVLGSLYPLYLAWEAWRLRDASEPSTCEVLSQRIDAGSDSDGSSNGYHPVIELAHVVGGQRYTREDRGKRFLTESDARAATSAFQVGNKVPCHYVAGSPEHVVALEQNPGQFRGMLFFGLFLWALPIGVFAWERKRPGWTGP